jgi:CelD/BcsL family acetyltransferase involved in cellulose biosynthesis
VVFTSDPPGEPLTNGIVCCEVDSRVTGRRLVSLPFSDHCEPLVAGPEEFGMFLTELQSGQAGRWKYVEIRPRSALDAGLKGRSGFRPGAQYFLHTLDLRPSVEQLYSSLHPDSIRRKIRRAEREGLTYKEGRSAALLDEFYRLQLLTRRRHRLPPQPLGWFRNLAACLGDKLKIRVASKQGRPVAAILTLRYKDVLTYKYGASDAEFHNLGGMALLFWRAIQEARQEGLREFDFGRSDCDNPGLVTYKERWGAARSTITYLRYPPPRPEAAAKKQAKRGSALARQVLSSAPDGMLTIAGKLMYRHFG